MLENLKFLENENVSHIRTKKKKILFVFYLSFLSIIKNVEVYRIRRLIKLYSSTMNTFFFRSLPLNENYSIFYDEIEKKNLIKFRVWFQTVIKCLVQICSSYIDEVATISNLRRPSLTIEARGMACG